MKKQLKKVNKNLFNKDNLCGWKTIEKYYSKQEIEKVKKESGYKDENGWHPNFAFYCGCSCCVLGSLVSEYGIRIPKKEMFVMCC